jgi:hypothetical protein
MPFGRKEHDIMKKSKRIFSALLSVLLLAGAFFVTPLTAHAADITVSIRDTG